MHNAFLSILLVSVTAAPIQSEPKPVLSKDPLTAEQIAIYRAVLLDYTKGEDTALNIANVTDPFTADRDLDDSCLRGIPVPPANAQSRIIHRLTPAVALNSRMVLVDPDQQTETVKKNDPQNLIMDSMKDQRTPSDTEMEESVTKAFATGLFTFSEILFNKQHTRAALRYGFYCGSLCGHGNTVVLRKIQGKWKVSKVCGGWIS